MKLGSDTLKQYIEEKDLSVDRIDDVFSYIENTLMDFDEIESAIKQNQSLTHPSDEEFEDEFNKLLKEETQESNKPIEDNKNTIEESISSETTKINGSNMSLDSALNEEEKDEKEDIELEEKMIKLAI